LVCIGAHIAAFIIGCGYFKWVPDMTVEGVYVLVCVHGERTHAVGSFEEELEVLGVSVGLFVAKHAFNIIRLVVEVHGLSVHAGCSNHPN
jgi:hypothetical protein